MLSDYILYLHPCPLNCDEYIRLNETNVTICLLYSIINFGDKVKQTIWCVIVKILVFECSLVGGFTVVNS